MTFFSSLVMGRAAELPASHVNHCGSSTRKKKGGVQRILLPDNMPHA